jgi:hypothetical protein
MRRNPVLGSLAAVTLVVALAACGGADEPTAAEVEADTAEELQELDSDLTDEQAECIAAAVIQAAGEGRAESDAEEAEDEGEEPEELSEAEIRDLGAEEITDIDFSAEEPEELEQEIATAAVAARDDCLGDGAAAPQ